MATTRLDKLCRAVLPPGYERLSREGPRIQKFLQENLPEPINQQVALLSIDAEQIVFSANSPVVANFLRLHVTEIQQQIRETLKLQQSIKFRSLPETLLKVERKVETPQPRAVSDESIQAIEKNAEWIEDDSLKGALKSLAESLRNH
ncbi:MAG: hypothetical protein AAF353_08245 [Pseudomonadota bacterium]